MSTTTTPTGPQTIVELRRHLFETLAALRDKTNPMPIDRARAVSEVANTIINSAKVEVEFARASKRAVGGGFVQLAAPIEEVPPAGRTEDIPKASAVPPMPANGITGVTRHLLKDD